MSRRESKRNPFEVKPQKTVRRDAKDVYPSKDDLRSSLESNKHNLNKPLDNLFFEIEKKLQGNVEEWTIQGLFERLFSKQENDQLAQRLKIIDKLLDYLLKIQELSEGTSEQLDDNLIKISLHDIKIMSKLLNVIILVGIYPTLDLFKIGLPLEKRMMNEFTKTKGNLKEFKFPLVRDNNYKFHEEMLTMLYTKFYQIFITDSDVKNLLLKGTGFSDFLIISIALITIPEFDQAKKQKLLQEYEVITKIPSTFELFQTYSLLIGTSSPTYFKAYVMQKLLKLPTQAPRNDGLLALVEFVLGLRDNEEVNVEKFEHVSNVIILKPKDLPVIPYFKSIFDQGYDILININRPIVTSCIGHVIERLFMKNRLIVHDFLFKKIWANLGGKNKVSETDVNNVINVLVSLTSKGLDSEMYKILFAPILLPIWSYITFAKSHSKSAEVVTSLLIGYFTVMGDSKNDDDSLFGLFDISQNLMYESDDWTFTLGPNGMIQISERLALVDSMDKDAKINKFLTNLESHCQYFVELLKNLDDEYTQKLFLRILRMWLTVSKKNNLQNHDENPFISLIDLRLLESIGRDRSETIAKTPHEVLLLIKEILLGANTENITDQVEKIQIEDADSDDEDTDEGNVSSDAYQIVLELLSTILSEPNFSVHKNNILLLNEIKDLLKRGSKLHLESTKATESVYEKISAAITSEKVSDSDKKRDELILKRALVSLNDPLVPLRAHGLYLLRKLLENGSDVVTVNYVIEQHLAQLKDPEPFVYLNAIKGLSELVNSKNKEVFSRIVAIYRDGDKGVDIEERLKLGEVILRFVLTFSELLAEEFGGLITGAALKIIRRPEDDTKLEDNRLRMSSMSILGLCYKMNSMGTQLTLSDALDCAIGILEFEKLPNSFIMRRAAVVLLHDVIVGVSKYATDVFPRDYRAKVYNMLFYILENDDDVLVRDHARATLDTIEELISLALN